MNTFFNTLTTIAFLALVVGLIKPSIYTKFFKKPATRKLILLFIGIPFLAFGIATAATAPPQPEKPQTAKTEEQTQATTQPQSQPEAKPAENLPTEPIARIEAILKSKYDKFEVSLYSRNSDFANATNGPYEVIANTPINALGDCEAAKRISFEAIRAIYTDNIAESNVLRVRVNALPYASASLGADDGKSLDDETWKMNGHTNFIKSLEAAGTQEKENTPPEKQSFWLERTGCSLNP